MSHSSQTRIVVMESGAEWPGWFVRAEADAETRVLAQYEGESLNEFDRRVASEINGLVQAGRRVNMAAIACSERSDDAMARSRRSMACAMLGAMTGVPGGTLLFTESQRKSGDARQALSSLAVDLSHEWEQSGVRVSVRFGDPSRPPQCAGRA